MTTANPLVVAVALLLSISAAPWCRGDDAAGLRARGLTVTEKDGAITALAGPFQGLGEEGITAITGLKELTSLNLNGTAITGKGMANLRLLTSLQFLNITTTRVSQLLVLDLVDFRLLMARHPDLSETIDAEAKRRVQENQ